MTMAGADRSGERRPGLVEGEAPAESAAVSATVPPAPTGALRTSTQPRPPAIARPRRDPRDEVQLADQDPVGLRFVGENCSVLQKQMSERCYPGRKESIISRRVHRWLRHGLVGHSRFLGMGANVLWLREKGARVLVEGGHARAGDLYPRSRAIPAGVLGHHIWIVDIIIISERGIPLPAERVEPAWLLQRRNDPQPDAVPDVLVTIARKAGNGRALLAYEVDLGTEALKVFVPKLEKLAGVLQSWADGGPTAVTILTRGVGRAAAIERACAELPIPILVKLLPKATGRGSLTALGLVLSRGAKSSGG